jgi:hypothetical protein
VFSPDYSLIAISDLRQKLWHLVDCFILNFNVRELAKNQKKKRKRCLIISIHHTGNMLCEGSNGSNSRYNIISLITLDGLNVIHTKILSLNLAIVLLFKLIACFDSLLNIYCDFIEQCRHYFFDYWLNLLLEF